MAPPISRLDSLLQLNRRRPVLLVLAWLAVCGLRPFTLGFYHDDWWQYVEPIRTTAFSLERWSAFVGYYTAYAPRPVFGALSFLFASLTLDSAVAAQSIAALLVLGCAWSLRRFLVELGAAWGEGRFLAADCAVIFWLTAPWSTGTTVFLGAAFGMLPAQFFFTEAARLSLSAPPTPVRSATIGLLLLASYTSYESFYFTVFPLAVSAWWLGRLRFADRTAAGCYWCALVTAQVAAILLNRYASTLNHGASKVRAPNWPEAWWLNIRDLPVSLADSLGPFTTTWGLILASFTVGLVIHLRRQRPKLPWGQTVGPSAGIIVGACGGIVLIAAIYAGAGYRFATVGVMGRTLGSVTCLLAVVCFALVGLIGLGTSSPGRRIAIFSFIAAFAVQLTALQHNQSKWATSWTLQQQVIARAPFAELAKLPPQSAVLFIGPDYHAGVEIFAAPWDLSAAVWSHPPLNAGRRPFAMPATIHPATKLYDWTFRAGKLVQELPGHFKQTFDATRLFVWDYEGGTFAEVADGYTRRANHTSR